MMESEEGKEGGERDRGIQDKLGEREMGDGQQKQAEENHKIRTDKGKHVGCITLRLGTVCY